MSTPIRHAPPCPYLVQLSALVLAACLPFGSNLRADHPGDSLALVYNEGMRNSMPYRLFLPPGYDTPGAEFPLVLRLHGSGGSGNDNLGQLQGADGLIDATQSERFASFLLLPQARGNWTLGGPIGNDFSNTLSPSMEMVTQVITLVESQYQIDTSRRYVMGFSMGGFGTWDLIAKRPEMFAAAVPIAGGGNPGRAADIAEVPLWAFHGQHDWRVDPRGSRDMIEALVDVGSDPLYLEPNVGHEIWQTIYTDPSGDLYPWMFEGVAPRLATVIYDARTGNLQLDARTAPGGTIDDFELRLRSRAGEFSLQPTMTVDGVVINTLDFVTPLTSTNLTFNGTVTDGFSEIADFGPLMPAGLSFQSLHRDLAIHDYSSPATGDALRTFRLIMAVPEPSALLLLLAGVVGLSVLRGRKRVAWSGDKTTSVSDPSTATGDRPGHAGKSALSQRRTTSV